MWLPSAPPAKALMHLLGLKLHSKHHVNGRTHRPVTTAMRTELRWWADHLTPDTFYKLPVEWMGSQLPPVNQWIHIYSVPLTGVWLVDFANNTSCFQPWLSSLAVSLFTAIELQLSSNAAIQQRMFHTRFIVNECGMARMINSGSSSDSSLQHALKCLVYGNFNIDTVSLQHLRNGKICPTLLLIPVGFINILS